MIKMPQILNFQTDILRIQDNIKLELSLIERKAQLGILHLVTQRINCIKNILALLLVQWLQQVKSIVKLILLLVHHILKCMAFKLI